MQTKSLDMLLEEANKQIKRLSFNESLEMLSNENTIVIDVREESEVINLGIIKNAIHIPRGLIEFKLSPHSSNNPNGIKIQIYLFIVLVATVLHLQQKLYQTLVLPMFIILVVIKNG